MTLSDLYGKIWSVEVKDVFPLAIGMICMIVGQLFHAGQGVLEEHILKSAGGQEPCYMMGWEGVFGLVITLVMIVYAQFLVCPFGNNECISGHIGDIKQIHEQTQTEKSIIVLAISFVVSAAAYNGFGVTSTKLTSATSRSVVE